MKRLLLTILAAAALLMADDAPSKQPPSVQKIFKLQYADANRVANLLRPLGIVVNAESQSNVLAVTGSPQTISAVEDALKKLDVPSTPEKNVDLTGYLLLGSSQGSDTPDVPELASVIKELRSLSPFKSYKLLESFNLRDRDGERGRVQGFLPGFSPTPIKSAAVPFVPSYDFGFNRLSVSSSSGSPVVRLDGVRLQVTIVPASSARIDTDIDIREGQKVVVGKTNANGADQALFLVLSAKLVE